MSKISEDEELDKIKPKTEMVTLLSNTTDILED